MKSKAMRLFSLFLTTGLLLAAEPAIHVARMRADIGFLSSPELQGRTALEPGGDITAKFIAAEFAKAGLKPFSGSGYLQEFGLVFTAVDGAQSRIRVVRDVRVEVFEPGNGFQGGFKEDIRLTADMVFAGYGITAPEYGYDDYGLIDARGRVVVVIDREPQEGDASSVFLGTGLTWHAAPRAKRMNAQAHGAVAVLSLPSAASTAAASERNPLRGSARTLYDEEIRIPMLTFPEDAADRLLPERKALQAQIDQTLKPASRALQGSIEIRLAHSSRGAGKTFNVIGQLPGSDPSLQGEAVILDAHYDHLPSRGEYSYPGANDNGSGTAALLELARAFAAGGNPPKRTILFIAFGAEENGLLGAYHYVREPVVALSRTRAVVNMDMIARNEEHVPQTEGRLEIPSDTSNSLNLIGGVYSQDLLAAAGRANQGIGLQFDLKFDRDSSQNALWRCDHFPFLVQGVPALWLFGGFHPGYHEPTDTVEKLDFLKLEKVAQLAYRLVTDLANTANPPGFRYK